MAKHSAETKKTKRRHKGLYVLLTCVLAICGVLAATFGYLLWQFGDYQYDSGLEHKTNEELGITDTTLTKKVTNIALFGIDARNATSFTGNSDSIMIISIDQIHNKVKVISVMRDTLVYLPNRGYCKLNSVYPRGADQSIYMLNTMFNLNIRDYATVNFVGMVDIINAVGGIEVNVTEAERQDANIHIGSMASEVGTPRDYIKKSGKQLLSGVQAVCWARVRHVATADGVNNDYGRTDRQRYVMEQLFQKAMNAGITQYPALIKALMPYVQTSLSYSEILSLAGALTGGITFEQTRVPLTEYQIDGDYRAATGSSTVYYNLSYAGKVVHAFLYDDIPPETYIAENGVDKTRWAG